MCDFHDLPDAGSSPLQPLRGQPDRVFRNAATAFAERWRCLKKVAGIYTCQIQVLRTFPLKTTFHSIFGYVDM